MCASFLCLVCVCVRAFMSECVCCVCVAVYCPACVKVCMYVGVCRVVACVPVCVYSRDPTFVRTHIHPSQEVDKRWEELTGLSAEKKNILEDDLARETLRMNGA